MLSEMVVAACERDVGSRTRSRERASGSHRATQLHRFVAGGFLTTESGEELVQVVHDRHRGTVVHAVSPICEHAPT